MTHERTSVPVPVRLAAPLLAAVLVLASCTPAGRPGPEDGPAAPSGSGAAVTPGEAGGGTGSEADKGDGEGSAAPDADGSAAPTSGGRSGGQSGGDGSEVAPRDPRERPPGEGLGDTTGPSAGRLGRAPETGSAAGLLPGFPDDVVLVPADAAVTSSSVTGADGRYQVTLDATVDGDCSDALLDYRAWFTAGGFAESGSSNRPDRTTVDLTRADGTVVLDAVPDDAACAVTVFAALSAR